jgi:hypothetical protein
MKTLKSLYFAMSVLAPAAVLFITSGCGKEKPSKAEPLNVQIELAPSLQGKSVLVDVVGVHEGDIPRWEAYSMTDYWKDGDKMRADADKKTYSFSPGQPLAVTLSRSDPAWNTWLVNKGAAYLFVLADLPGTISDKPGTTDPRRGKLCLYTKAWPKGTESIRVTIKESGVEAPIPVAGK